MRRVEGATKGFEAVTTKQRADEETAKRKTVLEMKGYAACPLCEKSHCYSKEWGNIIPLYRTNFMSTRLYNCPNFMSMTKEDRLRTVISQSACLYCSGWDHNQHRLVGAPLPYTPACTFYVDGRECGGNHGSWYHMVYGNYWGISHSASVTAEEEGNGDDVGVGTPSLYEVVRVRVGSEMERTSFVEGTQNL